MAEVFRMQGLDIAKEYYETYGAAAIHESFPELEGVIAVGLAGSGSECYGYDDPVSADHDFEPGFCLWIPEESELDSRTAFRLQRMYDKLPRTCMGYCRNVIQPAGGSRHGVMRISEFLERHIGRKDEKLSLYDWFNIPEFALSEVVNGQVWRDDSGKFTAVRNRIRNMPEDVRLKKLAGSLYLMGQSGRYNYARCVAHGEKGAAQLALAEFAKHTMRVAFLVNRQYMPYYKWSFRGLRGLPLLSELSEKLEYLLNTGNEAETVEQKRCIIAECEEKVSELLRQLGLAEGTEKDLGDLSESVNRKITDSAIRNADILAGAGTAGL